MRNHSPVSELLAALVIFLSLHSLSTLNAQENSSPAWAIVIHGGAGGNPTKWDPVKRAAREKGLMTALEAGKRVLENGGSSLDAVENVIRILEDDASFNAGRGAVVTSEGKAELDASIMDGQTRQCGAIAGVTIVKNPISLARKVMTNTKHVLLVAKGADEFAAQQKVPLVRPDYFLSFNKAHSNAHSNAMSNTPDPNGNVRLPVDQDTDTDPHYGTVGCVALDTAGHLAAGTSTGGTSKKLPGRVGDSPIIGAGTFADDETCAVSGTGIGEQYIRHSIAYDVIAQMKYSGVSLTSAINSVMQDRLNEGDGGIIGLSKHGDVSMHHTTPGMNCGFADSTGRFETHLILENGKLNVPSGDAPTEEKDVETIRDLILQQSADWNAGDLDAFMNVYWKSEDLTFSSAGQTTRGWEATIARYRTRYPDRATMGKTEFSELEFVRLDRNAFQVLGRWELKRESDPIGGRFTLIFKKIKGDWKIIHDHTSARKG